MFRIIRADKIFMGKYLRASYLTYDISSVIRQKGKSQNGGNMKIKHIKFSEKQTFLTSPPLPLPLSPLIRTCKYTHYLSTCPVLIEWQISVSQSFGYKNVVKL